MPSSHHPAPQRPRSQRPRPQRWSTGSSRAGGRPPTFLVTYTAPVPNDGERGADEAAAPSGDPSVRIGRRRAWSVAIASFHGPTYLDLPWRDFATHLAAELGRRLSGAITVTIGRRACSTTPEPLHLDMTTIDAPAVGGEPEPVTVRFAFV